MSGSMSRNRETAAEFRTEIDHLRNLTEDDMASVSVDLLRLAADALDSSVAENQRLREALGVARPYVYNAMYDRQVNKGWRYQTAVESLRTVDEALAGDAE